MSKTQIQICSDPVQLDTTISYEISAELKEALWRKAMISLQNLSYTMLTSTESQRQTKCRVSRSCSFSSRLV